MQRARKSRSGVIALVLVAATCAAYAPAPALAQVDEYELNLPDGGSGGSTDTADGTTTGPAPAATVPVPATTAPVPTVPTSAEPIVIDPVTGRPKPKPKPVYGTTSPNAALGPQAIPPLRLGAGDDGLPLVPVGLAALALAACGLGVWRLRYLREVPARAPGPARGATSLS